MIRTRVTVITLSQAVERRAQFAAAAKDAAVAWDFFSAYTEVSLPLKYDRRLAVQQFGRPLSSGEIGCYTSHYKAWESLVNSNDDQIIVLEDDVLVDWPIVNRLAECKFSGLKIDILRLLATHTFPFDISIHRFISPHSQLLRNRGLFLGTQGYLLTRRGAEALLSTGTVIASPVDWVMSRYWEYNVPNYCLFPFPIIERYTQSTIGSSTREASYQATTVDRAARLYWRIKNRIIREYMNIAVFKKHPFGETVDVGEAYIDKVFK
jgi:glycosyl transferase, family 25